MTENKININDKEYGIFFGYSCYKLFIIALSKHRTAYLTEEGELTRIGLSKLFFSGYQNWCMLKEIDFELTIDDITEWVDQQYETDEGQQLIIALCQKWADSKEFKKLTEASEKKTEDPNLTS